MFILTKAIEGYTEPRSHTGTPRVDALHRLPEQWLLRPAVDGPKGAVLLDFDTYPEGAKSRNVRVTIDTVQLAIDAHGGGERALHAILDRMDPADAAFAVLSLLRGLPLKEKKETDA